MTAITRTCADCDVLLARPYARYCDAHRWRHREEHKRPWTPVRENYTLRELTLCFGVDHRVIERWVREGRLAVEKRGYQTDRDAWAVTDAALLRFIADHPMAFELRRVDQCWFLDLILSGGLIKKALAQLAAEDAEERAA